MDIEKFKQSILNSIETIVNQKSEKLSFDQTYATYIVNKSQVSATEYKYYVKIGQNNYTIITSSNYSIGDKVRVKIPCNNWSNIYIEESFATTSHSDGSNYNEIDVLSLLGKEY